MSNRARAIWVRGSNLEFIPMMNAEAVPTKRISLLSIYNQLDRDLGIKIRPTGVRQNAVRFVFGVCNLHRGFLKEGARLLTLGCDLRTNM